jgi:hypothetical protein
MCISGLKETLEAVELRMIRKLVMNWRDRRPALLYSEVVAIF